jgi:hypothetical protein
MEADVLLMMPYPLVLATAGMVGQRPAPAIDAMADVGR